MKIILPHQRLGIVLLLGMALSISCPTWAAAASDKPYYEGKTITVIISSSPGGGTDAAGRLAAGFLPKLLPGNPKTIVQNMPGGGDIIANNYFASEAKPDGLTLMMDSSSGLGQFTRGGDRIKYDPRKYKAVGSIGRGGSVLMVRKGLRSRLTDIKGEKLVVGDTDGIRTWVSMTVWGAEYLGWNLRYIYGYKGSKELALALRQGEIDVWATQNAKLVKDLMKEGVVEAIAQEDSDRRPDFPDIPSFIELLGNKRPSGAAWEAFLSWTGPTAVDKYMVAPPGTPDDIVALLRTAFKGMEKDPGFRDQATKFFGAAWTVRDGQKTEAMIREVTTITPAADEFLTQIRKKYGLPMGK